LRELEAATFGPQQVDPCRLQGTSVGYSQQHPFSLGTQFVKFGNEDFERNVRHEQRTVPEGVSENRPSGDGWFRQAESFPNPDNDSIESSGIEDGHFCQCPPVEFTTDLFKPGNELAVPQAPLAAGGIDPDDPEAAEVPLAATPVTMGEHSGPDDRLLRRSQ